MSDGFDVNVNTSLLQRALAQVGAQLPDIADQIVRKIAFDVVAEVAERVPVDTGRLRAGWRVSLDVLAGDGESDTVSVEEDEAGIFLTVTNPVRYAPFIEYGTAYIPPGLQLSTAIENVRSKLSAELAEALIVETWDQST